MLQSVSVTLISYKSQHALTDPSRLASHVAKAVCVALLPHLDKLREEELSPLAVRVCLDPENVRPIFFPSYIKKKVLTRKVLTRKVLTRKVPMRKVLTRKVLTRIVLTRKVLTRKVLN